MKINTLYRQQLRSIHYISAVILLWGLADALISFLLPVQVEQFVGNLTLFGMLMGFSSLVGAMSDPLLGFLANRIRYVFFLAIGLLLSLLLITAASAPFSLVLILWLMTLWGLYYEFIEIGIFSYVSRHHDSNTQSKYFGIIYLFLNLAYVLGPIIAGLLITHGTRTILAICFACIVLGALFLPYIALLHHKREPELYPYRPEEQYSMRKQWHSFKHILRYTWVFLVAACIFNIWDACVWTLVPVESISGNAIIAGLLTGVFTLPLALFSGVGGETADKFGRHATFLVGLLVASIATVLFGIQTTTGWQIAYALLASFGFAFAYPALMGATSEAAQDHQSQLGNIAASQRLFTNVGYIAGPILGGVLAAHFGLQHAFAVLGGLMLIAFIPIAGTLIHFKVRGRIHKTIAAEFEL